MDQKKNKIQVKAPTWLMADAKKEWKRIFELYAEEEIIIEEKDLKAIEGYCVSYSTWKKAEEIINEKGFTFETPSGYEQQRPEVSIANKAQAEMRSWMKELAFTKSARARINKNNSSPVIENKTQEEIEMEDIVSE